MLAVVTTLALCSPVHESDVHRFHCSAAFARQSWEFGVAHCDWLSKNEPYAWGWIEDAAYCRRAWDLLDDCKRIYKDDPAMRKQRLYWLREHLGPVAYSHGWMPYPVPVWRFREVR